MADTSDDKILHEDDVREVIEDEIDEERPVPTPAAAIADVGAAGVAYVQAEANATIDALNDVLAALRTAGIIEAE